MHYKNCYAPTPLPPPELKSTSTERVFVFLYNSKYNNTCAQRQCGGTRRLSTTLRSHRHMCRSRVCAEDPEEYTTYSAVVLWPRATPIICCSEGS